MWWVKTLNSRKQTALHISNLGHFKGSLIVWCVLKNWSLLDNSETTADNGKCITCLLLSDVIDKWDDGRDDGRDDDNESISWGVRIN